MVVEADFDDPPRWTVEWAGHRDTTTALVLEPRYTLENVLPGNRIDARNTPRRVCANLATISSDTTIDDATYWGGIDVASGATITINSPADLGFTYIGTEQIDQAVSVRANDTSTIIVTGGTLNGGIRLLDSSMLTLSGSPTTSSPA